MFSFKSFGRKLSSCQILLLTYQSHSTMKKDVRVFYHRFGIMDPPCHFSSVDGTYYLEVKRDQNKIKGYPHDGSSTDMN